MSTHNKQLFRTYKILAKNGTIRLTLEQKHVKVSFLYSIFSSKIGTIKVQRKNKWATVGKIKRTKNKLSEIFTIDFYAKNIQVEKIEDHYCIANQELLLLTDNRQNSLKINHRGKHIGSVVYPKSWNQERVAKIHILKSIPTSIDDKIKYICIAICTSNVLKGVGSDRMDPFDIKQWW